MVKFIVAVFFILISSTVFAEESIFSPPSSAAPQTQMPAVLTPEDYGKQMEALAPPKPAPQPMPAPTTQTPSSAAPPAIMPPSPPKTTAPESNLLFPSFKDNSSPNTNPKTAPSTSKKNEPATDTKKEPWKIY